jgi:hypothetical protein
MLRLAPERPRMKRKQNNRKLARIDWTKPTLKLLELFTHMKSLNDVTSFVIVYVVA